MRFRVLRDTGEKKGWEFRPSKACLGTAAANLYTGDYTLEGWYDDRVVVVERKGSVAELAGNLSDEERWDDFRQELERMEEFRFPAVVCEFTLAQLVSFPAGSRVPRSAWPRVRARGPYLLKRVCELELAMKTRWVFAGSREAAQAYVLSVFKRVVESCGRD